MFNIKKLNILIYKNVKAIYFNGFEKPYEPNEK